MKSPSESGYLLSTSQEAAGTRLAALSEIFDPVTFRHMDSLGLAPGWKCWEVGAGGTSVVRWLSERIGAAGRVVATDIDVTSLAPAASANVAVLVHDVARDRPPGLGFELVHTRLVLVHVPDRAAALRSMAASLAPGGWMLVEDADPGLQPLSCIDPHTAEEELANRIRSGFRALMAERGVDLSYGRKLPGELRSAGLTEVAADAWFPIALPACATLEAATIAIIRPQLLSHGIASEEEIAQHLASVAAGRLDLSQPPLVSAWGRRPP